MIDKRSLLAGAGGVIAGAGGALAGRALVTRLALAKLRRDVRRLNGGDYHPLLSGYAEDAVLVFNEGPHRWSGEHRGRASIERFLRDFTLAGIQGEVRALWIAGPPWALTLIVRFDDGAAAPDGEELYANRVVILARTRWGKIVEQEDYYLDSGRIVAFEEKLRARGVGPAAG